MDYYSLRQPNSVTYEVKRSQFIGICASAKTRDKALETLSQIKRQYPDARHYCWAYLLGSPFQPISMAASDDGEPSGTAGKPILNVLQHNKVGNVMLVVVRYFGGVKLGAGGLVRAYSAAAQQVMDSAETVLFIPHCTVVLECSFAQEQHVRHVLSQQQGNVLNCEYQSKVTITFEIPNANLPNLQQRCELNQWLIKT